MAEPNEVQMRSMNGERMEEDVRKYFYLSWCVSDTRVLAVIDLLSLYTFFFIAYLIYWL